MVEPSVLGVGGWIVGSDEKRADIQVWSEFESMIPEFSGSKTVSSLHQEATGIGT
jgi:hypothetical protein